MTLPSDQALCFEGAEVLLPDGSARISVRVEGDRIAAFDAPQGDARRIDVSGLILAPAFVDIHGDAFERQMMPRPGVFISDDVAIFDTDRQLAAAGIATAYHAVTLGWEPGLRDLSRAEAFIEALGRLAPRLGAENRVQLRWEIFCFEARPVIQRALEADLTPAVAFNDHTSSDLLPDHVPVQERPFAMWDGYPTTDLHSAQFIQSLSERVERSGLSSDAFAGLFREKWARRDEVPGAIDDIAALTRSHGAPLLSHDDSQPEMRDYFRAQGARISEFPMRREVARAARDAGDWIVFGGPNAARGGSHLGSQGAGEMVAEGLCDILASDYHYPSLLSAVARMARDKIAPVHELWKQVSQNPAEALGLTGRGRIEPGARADLVLVDWPEGETPSVVATLRSGRFIYASRAF
jgi:alpha-D-ribose 1-methylphosphonate 5-triphosphate diphosphatase